MASETDNNASVQQEGLTSSTYLLTDIENVPDLLSITPIQALSYLNQSLENLILLYQSTSAFRNATDKSDIVSPPSESEPSSGDQPEGSPLMSPRISLELNKEVPLGGSTDDLQAESESDSMLSSQSRSSNTSNSSSSSLVTTIQSVSLSYAASKSPDSSASNTGATATPPHPLPYLASKSSADTNSILEEAAVVAAVLIEGAEQRRRSSGRLAPVDSRLTAAVHHSHELSTTVETNETENHHNNNKNNDNNNNNDSSQQHNGNNNQETNNDHHENNDDNSTSNSNNDHGNLTPNGSSRDSLEIAVTDSDNSVSTSPSITSPRLQAPPPPMATRLAVSKKEMAEKGQIIKRFWSRNAPTISIWDYLLRIQKFSPMSASVYLSASLYIYRLCIELRTLLLTPLSVHRIILASLRVACKTIEDKTYKQKRFAATGGVRPADLYRLEIAFLYLIDFDVCINSNILQEHLVTLTEIQIQADRHRQLLNKKRPRSSDSEPNEGNQ